jgi:hypothetical protein
LITCMECQVKEDVIPEASFEENCGPTVFLLCHLWVQDNLPTT